MTSNFSGQDWTNLIGLIRRLIALLSLVPLDSEEEAAINYSILSTALLNRTHNTVAHLYREMARAIRWYEEFPVYRDGIPSSGSETSCVLAYDVVSLWRQH